MVWQDYITGQKTTGEKVQDYASDTYDAAGRQAQSAYEAAAEAGADAYHSAGQVWPPCCCCWIKA